MSDVPGTVFVLNGPNLSRLGSREPEVYGTVDFETATAMIEQWAREHGRLAVVRASDDEADLVHWLHEAADRRVPVILNPAAFTHYSYALRDAAAQVVAADCPLIEVHLSNPASRETFRHHSVISGVSTGTIAGFGLYSYYLALVALEQH